VPSKITSVPKIGDVIENGSFEEGFNEQGVALGWAAFSTDKAVYSWADESEPMHVSHGSHAQLMSIQGPIDPNRFVGIYQTVDVVAGETYTLALHGLIRSTTAQGPKTLYGHRTQWAIDYEGKASWYEIEWAEWTDPGWNDIDLKDKRPVMNVYILQITPETDKLTLYIRGWTKWNILGSEAKYYLDGVFLKGPIPGEETIVKEAVVMLSAGAVAMPTTGGDAISIPVVGIVFVLGFGLWEVRKTRGR